MGRVLFIETGTHTPSNSHLWWLFLALCALYYGNQGLNSSGPVYKLEQKRKHFLLPSSFSIQQNTHFFSTCLSASLLTKNWDNLYTQQFVWRNFLNCKPGCLGNRGWSSHHGYCLGCSSCLCTNKIYQYSIFDRTFFYIATILEKHILGILITINQYPWKWTDLKPGSMSA